MRKHSAFGTLICLAVAYTFLVSVSVVFSLTDPNDFAILREFRNGIENSELLGWPDDGDDPCGQQWEHVFCKGSRVSQIQVKNMGLKGTLPPDLGKLAMLSNIGLQRNKFSGTIPSFNGLSNLQYAFLDYNEFDSIPADFFDRLPSLEILALDGNMLNASMGWMLPIGLVDSTQLTTLSCMSCNLVGPLPDFIGRFPSLLNLKLSGNSLSGEIPKSFEGANLQNLWLNNQNGDGFTGSIDVVTTMTSLNTLWLHGNHFSGTIPENIGNLVLLKNLNLNGNRFVGPVPQSLANLPLDNLDLNNNQLMGPIPSFKATNVSFASNSFCQSTSGVACTPEVMALLLFLGALNYPSRLVSSWTGNNPCSLWLGVACQKGNVWSIVLPNMSLSGNLSASIGKLRSLAQIKLQNNNLTGQIPVNWTELPSLKTLDLHGNNIYPPVPPFLTTVDLNVDGNPLLYSDPSGPSTSAGTPSKGSSPNFQSPSTVISSSIPKATGNDSNAVHRNRNKTNLFLIIVPLLCFAVLSAILVPISLHWWRRKRDIYTSPGSLVIHPRDPFESDEQIKVAVATHAHRINSLTGSGSSNISTSVTSNSHTIETGNLVISVQVLRKVTKNFSQENELGRGGFGVVYKGELEDGTKIAVKRMEAGVLGKKALDEFQAEIAVLSQVRHRHLVSLLGYSIEGNERILVYEYMTQGALSRHLFHWKRLKLEPLSWKRRLNIALDVARGVEYLHNLAHQSFIHRDLKSSNILLGDDFRAKVADFGLVRLAPNGEKSVVTRLAGTFGYLAPEYAVTGKITTKADVFSFGVVLMELLTGWMALDEDRPEESQYLAAWFWRIKMDDEKLKSAIDPTLDVTDETFESISTIAELAGHCTAREPSQRPDMSHAVNLLAPLVEKWKPLDDETEDYCGIDYSLPLNQMVKGWQEAEGKDASYVDLDDSKGSIPARPTGFADSFTSADGR